MVAHGRHNFLLSLAFALGACSSSGGPGNPPEGHADAAALSDSGGTQACGRAAGACVNATDCRKTRTEMAAKVAECGQRCLGAGPCTATCMKDGLGLTQECSQCWGTVVQCGRDKCLTQCAGGSDSMACRDCTATAGCDATFATCSGL